MTPHAAARAVTARHPHPPVMCGLQAEEMAARVAAARQRHVQLTERLLAVARHADALEGRFASWKGMG